MAFMTRKVSVTLKLPQLQNLIKRDPTAYREEFLMQKRHFDSELEIFKLRPTADSERFTDLVSFMSHVASSYREECSELPASLLELMDNNASTLHPDVRAKLLAALIHLRNKSIIDPLVLIKLAFKLMAVADKSLRLSLGEYVFNDIKAINLNKHNDKLNRRVQAVLFGLVEEDSVVARKAVEILAELYRRRVWTDARTINVLAAACTSQSTKVVVSAINFFLGIETQMHEDEDEEVKKVNSSQVDYHQHSKKTRKRQRHVEKQVEHNAKLRREQATRALEATPLFPAIQLINDPQTLAEKLFQKLRQSGERFEVKLLVMNFVSRLIGCHKLLLLSFYSFLQRYLTSHQQDVTRILAYLVQSSHDLVPPEELMPIIRTITHNFITERCTNEAITVGLNAVREVFARVPALLREEGMEDLVQDLAMYGRKTHKSVMIASHGIVNLVREIYPTLLRKADRGKHHNPKSLPAAYGAEKVSEGVAGADLLEAYERGDVFLDEDGDLVWKEDVKDDDEEMEEDEEEEEEDEDDDAEAPELVALDESGGGGEEEDEDDEEDDEEEEEEEAEDGDDASENSWAYVGQEDDEDEEVDAHISKKQRTETKHIKERVEALRILSSEDFELINRLRAAQAEREKDPKFRVKIKGVYTPGESTSQELLGEEDGAAPLFLVDPDELGASVRTSKTSKVDRITKVLEGRKDSKFEHNSHGGGLTNKEKLRKKNYVMVRKGKRCVNDKIRKSNSDVRYDKMKKKEQFGREKRKRRRT